MRKEGKPYLANILMRAESVLPNTLTHRLDTLFAKVQ